MLNVTIYGTNDAICGTMHKPCLRPTIHQQSWRARLHTRSRVSFSAPACAHACARPLACPPLPAP